MLSKPKPGGVGGQLVGSVVIDPQEIVYRVSILVAVQPVNGHLAGIDVGRIDFKRPVFNPIGQRFDFCRGLADRNRPVASLERERFSVPSTTIGRRR